MAGVRLAAVIAGRDNNLNLMRFLAAALVMVNHAFGITGHTATEPFYRVFELGGGDIGVDVFFVLSGFLVTRSWEGKPLPAFLWARCMRIYPGLWVSVLVTVILAGACFATVPRLEFWSSRSTLAYVGHNLLMLPHLGARLDLPHAFTAAGSGFNVSLWTLPLEIQMYLTLALLGVLLGIRARYLAALTLLGVGIVLVSKLTHSSHDMLLARGRFLYFFFAGSLAYALRGRIILRSRTAATLLALVLATIAVTGVFAVRQAMLALALPYLMLWLAYVPGGFVRRWNRLGDYSYGLYIYSVPIQIGVSTLGLGTTPALNFGISLAIALIFAAASWHLLERRALHRPVPGWLARVRIPAPLLTRPR